MKGLATLIRIQKRELDEIRKKMAVLQDKRDALLARYHGLHDELVAELEMAASLTEMRGFFGDFSESIKKKQEEIKKGIREVETHIQRHMIEVQKRFGELKKYEIAKENYDKREKQALDKQQQQAMDEIGVQLYINKHHSNSDTSETL